MQNKKNNCPINREFGKRVIEPISSEDNIKRTECTCIYFSGFRGKTVVPKCEHYKGIKQVQRNKKKVWKVFCEVVKQ